MTRMISFQGILGAYSHLACLEAAPGYTPLPCADFESAIRAVHEGKAERALLPIDNSIAGRVADIYHLLPQSGLHIIGEYFLPVRHCLLGLKGATLESIRTVTSHIHALPQCRNIIAKQGWQKQVSIDTAAAAEVAQRGDASWAAIASSLAAELYGLEILESYIADAGNNTTRFVMMAPKAIWPAPDTPDIMTSLVFHVRSVPAVLYKALGGFATNGLNLAKIESYMVNGEFDAATFYCEIEGHPETQPMKYALDELGFYAPSIEILGVYSAHASRK